MAIWKLGLKMYKHMEYIHTYMYIYTYTYVYTCAYIHAHIFNRDDGVL